MKKTKYIYILSQRYSGSTLLSFLLSTHPDISTIGERRKFFNKSYRFRKLKHHRAIYCSCGAFFDECDYLLNIKNQLEGKFIVGNKDLNFTEFRFHPNKYLNYFLKKKEIFRITHPYISNFFNTGSMLKSLQSRNIQLINTIMEQDGTNVFLDSSKSLEHALFLNDIKELDLHIIWMVRDPRAQVNSAIKYNNQWSTRFAGRRWVQEMRNYNKAVKNLNLNYLQIKYEDFCEDPEHILGQISSMIGMDRSDFDLNFRNQNHHIIGNGKMRLGSETSIIEKVEWKTELNKEQVEEINRIAINYAYLYPELKDSEYL